MLSYQDAIHIVMQTIRPLPSGEVALAEALGKVLASPLQAQWDLPPADNSAMDGYAFAFADQAVGTVLPVMDFVPAGKVLERIIPAGHAVKIMTGAPLPPGCDTVIPIEDVTLLPAGVRLERRPKARNHVRYRGEELRRGDFLVPPGTPIRAGETALLAGGGAERVQVHPTPRVAIVSTGDELVELGVRPGPGQIVNTNCHFLASRLREEGFIVHSVAIARDEAGELAAQIDKALEADLILTTGGVSVGDRDLVQEILGKKGFQLGFWKVGIKPGKPLLFGTLQGKPVFGLPGNPSATAVTFELFVRPALKLLAGHSTPFPSRLRARLAEPVQGDAKRQLHVWGTLYEEAGTIFFRPSPRQGSGQNRSFQGAMALMPMPEDHSDLSAGSEVSVLVFRLPAGPTPQTPLVSGWSLAQSA